LGFAATGEFIYSRDLNAMSYVNANLPAAQSAYAGVDNRPHWVGPACAAAGQSGPCVNRLNNATGNQITQNIVLLNQNQSRSWSIATTLARPLLRGFSVKGAYSYGVSRNTTDSGAGTANSWTSTAIVSDPNNPPLAFSGNSPGHRVIIAASHSRQYFHLGSTTASLFFAAFRNGSTSYTFAGDANGDGVGGNDLIYIPRNQSEMNFKPLTVNGKTFTAADQAAAFEAYIGQDAYLGGIVDGTQSAAPSFFPWSRAWM
jgi:hypothetical protein